MKKLLIILIMLSLLTSCSSKSIASNNENGSVYYEIYVGSFNDSNNDGIGDLNGITEKLDYLQALGVSGLWLMPISESDTYHKYDVIDYLSVDSNYGTMDDFENLVTEANKRHIEIILDLVLNHTASNNPWFITAKNNWLNGTCDSEDSKCDYYNFSDTAQSGYTKINDNLYYEAQFWSEMPDLNLDNSDVRDEIKQIVDFWLDKGVKGFRLDAVLYYYAGNLSKNNEFVQWLTDYIKTKDEDAYIVGEVWADKTSIITSYESGIDSLFNFTLAGNDGKISKAISNQNGQDLAAYFVSYNQEIKSINADAKDAIFLSNHDQNRSAGYIFDPNKQKLAASIYLLAPGVPFIYYGEEIGMKGSGIDENKRLAMLWGENNDCDNPQNADYAHQITTNVQEELADDDSLLNYYKKVIAIRNKYSIFLDGTVSTFNVANQSLMALTFTDDQTSLTVIHNLSDQEVKEILSDDYQIIDQISPSINATIQNNTLTIAPYASVIIQEN